MTSSADRVADRTGGTERHAFALQIFSIELIPRSFQTWPVARRICVAAEQAPDVVDLRVKTALAAVGKEGLVGACIFQLDLAVL